MSQDRLAAAEARKAAFAAPVGGAGNSTEARSQAPAEVGRARVVPCGAQMRAQVVTRDGKDFVYLDGIASVTDKAYRMYDSFGEYDEVIERGAFARTLAANPDVVYLLNHKGLAMARTTNGTLKLSMAPEGLRSEAWLNPQRQDVADLLVAINDGVVTEMSFAFMLERGEWSDDFSTFHIRELDIHRGDVSAVNYGANPYTTAARSREILDDLEHLPAGARREALARLQGVDVTRPGAPVEVPPLDAPIPPVPAPVEARAAKLAPTGGMVAFYEQLLDLT